MQKFKTNFDLELEKCVNMEQVLDTVSKHYDLSQPFGIATKIMVIGGVKKIIQLIKALPKL
jgi:hypothetical protein